MNPPSLSFLIFKVGSEMSCFADNTRLSWESNCKINMKSFITLKCFMNVISMLFNRNNY